MATPVISVMLIVSDTPAAVQWYERALGAQTIWDLGGVAGDRSPLTGAEG